MNAARGTTVQRASVSPGAPQTAVPSERLPRGRHKLDPEQVVESQRRRIFDAMAAATAAKGYVATTVADILALAGVSRETFYEQFSSKLDCFEQAFLDASTLLFSQIDSALPPKGTPTEKFDRLLGAYLESLASHPEVARHCLIEVYAAGPALTRRRALIQDRFSAGLEALFEARDERSRFACQVLVASISSMVSSRLVAGDLEGLRELRRPFSELARATFENPPSV